MQMTLDLVKDTDWNDFLINYIPEKLFKYVMLNLNEDKLIKIDDYLNNTLLIPYSSEQIIKYAFNNLFISDTDKGFMVMIDKNINIPNTKYNLLSILKLIDFGNLEIRGCNRISQAFDYVVNQLHNLVSLYKLNIGGDS